MGMGREEGAVVGAAGHLFGGAELICGMLFA